MPLTKSWNYLRFKESEELKDVQDEFENNRSTKISQKEVDELMQELFEAYELDKEENKMAKKHKKKEFTVSIPRTYLNLCK